MMFIVLTTTYRVALMQCTTFGSTAWLSCLHTRHPGTIMLKTNVCHGTCLCN